MKLSKAWALRRQREAYHATLPDDAAALIPADAKLWKPNAHYAADGTRWQDPFDGKLYRVKPGMGHDAPNDENYAPSRAVSLWTKIADPSQTGTRDNPIEWSPGMVLTTGLYYTENGVLYVCIRDEGPDYAMHQVLAALVGNYVQIVE